jgi:hypothetical protein
MKPRKWVIVASLCLLTVAAGIVLGVHRLEKGRNIERILVERLSASTGGEFSVGRVRLGFFSVYLQNISASLSTHSFNIGIRDIQVAFSLWKLIRTRGDFGKSISKIILISPLLDIRLAQNAPAQQPPPPAESGRLFSLFRNFPVQYLLVRRGAVTLTTPKGGRVVLGEELAGRVWDEERALMMDLRGTMASNRKNLFVSASFSKTGGRHRVSLRLDKAQIQRPLTFRGVTVTGGVFDGVFEFSFPDSLTAETLESNGWLRVSRGTCDIAGYGAPITSIDMSVGLSNTTVRLDSLRCETGGGIVSGKGAWDLADVDSNESSVVVRAAGIRPDAFTGLSSSFVKNVSGTAWAEAKLSKRRHEAAKRFSITAGGPCIFGFTLTSAGCQGGFDATQVNVDSLTVRGPAFKVQASGIATFEKAPVAYSVSFKASLDSLKNVPALRGQLAVEGTIRGLGGTYLVDASAHSRSLAFNGINLGAPEVRITTSDGKGLSFSSMPGNGAYFAVTGILDSLTGASPLVACNATAGPRLITDCIARLQPDLARNVDSARVVMMFKGTAKAFLARGQAEIALRPAGAMPRIHGGLDVQLDKAEQDGSVRWQISQRNLAMADSLVPLRGQGSVCGDSLRIDSLVVLTGVRGGGLVRFGGAAAGIDMTVRCQSMPIAALNRLFFNGKLPVSAGTLFGATRITGGLDRVRTDSELHLRGGAFGVLTAVETDAVVQTRDTVFTVFPFVVRQNGAPLAAVDTVTNKNGLRYSGTLRDVGAWTLFGPALPEDFTKEDHDLHGTVSGEFASTRSGAAAAVTLHSDGITLDAWRLDRIRASATIDGKGIFVHSFSAEDSLRAKITASGFVPWSVIANEEGESDTLDAQAVISGDLVASVEHNAGVPLAFPVSGHGVGTIEAALRGTRENMRLTKAAVQIPRGVVRVMPYVPEEIKDFSLRMTLDNAAAAAADSGEDNTFTTAGITTVMSGTVGRRPVRIHSTHTIPTGFEPITLGFLDFGALLVSTPKRGVDVHVPGLMEIGAVADVEFDAKAPFPEFALSGPVDRLCITGTWLMRSSDITFPLLDNMETHVKFDPFPYIHWNLDMRAGNRKVMYYYDTGKNRKLMRFVECYVDPVSVLSMRGRDLDNTFQLLGALRSNTGSVFFARTFDRNVDVGLDFVPQPLGAGKGYDNTPIIWGSAQAMSDTSRFDLIRLTLITRDSATGAWSERGRLYDVHFRVGADIETIPGESEKQFVTDEGKQYGSIGGAGQFVSTMGEQYLHRMLLQNLQRRLAKTLGLDVINVETSIASNYFTKLYAHQFDWSKWDYLTFANVGVTLGRYILYDKVFLKWRTELVPLDTVLRPQYDLGFEVQPLQPILLDVSYGIYKGDKSLEANPTVNLWLQLPIKDLRKLFDF